MKYATSNFESKREFAQVISGILQPLMVTIPVFIIVNYFTAGKTNFFILTLICLTFATFLPFAAALMRIKSKNLDFDISDKDERIFPLLLGAISCLIGVIMLFIIGAPVVVTVLMFSYFSNALLITLITSFWKISVHSIGVAGPAAAMIYIFGYWGLLFVFPLLMVMWSRIYLHKHTPAQVIVGAATGFIFTGLQFKILVA